ncbi:MAG TPA: ribosome-associated translation inhibitor RaiA [Bryobacteraceae bacterium]|jgi:putative sigma-54 modulation protein|nr:ribosome-associated translation inhibitor RaiA [Bryobacteraceae bacterium]
MKVTYTGRHMELSPEQSAKLTAEFEKIGKLLDNGRGEAEAHVVLAHERQLNNVEITVPYHNHELVGHGSHTDLFSAFHAALDKLEGQAIKLRGKWRDGKRTPGRETGDEEETTPETTPAESGVQTRSE